MFLTISTGQNLIFWPDLIGKSRLKDMPTDMTGSPARYLSKNNLNLEREKILM